MVAEEWRPIPQHSGYEASSRGRVRGIDRLVPGPRGGWRRQRGQVLKQWTGPRGYQKVGLSQVTKSVHPLVLAAFVGERPPGMYACHNDGNPANNHIANLRWDTPRENTLDVIRHGRNPYLNRTHCPRGHELVEPNLVASTWRRGYRDCLACARGRSCCRAIRRRGGTADLAAVADRYHQEIMRSAGSVQ